MSAHTKRESLDKSFEHLSKTALKVKAERDVLLNGCIAAYHALRSYQYGNIATDLAEEVAGELKEIIKKFTGQ